MSTTNIALNRFGLGARANEGEDAAGKNWLTGQMTRYQPDVDRAQLAGRAQIIGVLAEYRDAQRDKRQQKRAGATAPAMAELGMTDPAKPDAMAQAADDNPGKEMRQFSRNQHIAQVGLRVRTAVGTTTPFVEHLVHFWSNHFAVSADKQVTIALAGLMEFEAVRPHVLGRFEDMLLAVEQHPAMLLYLDQAQSVGPDSPLGQRAARAGRKAGLNENLGREILELHTLGVRTVYDQNDVTEFARSLTGWTVGGFGRGPTARFIGEGKAGDFLFAPALHQPGTRTVLGKTYAQAGQAQARAVLADLARHPATAKHLATKLARHFVADDPPPALVARLEKAYLDSDGDLPTVYRAMIDAPESWAPVALKFRTPWEWTIAVFRSVDGGRNGAMAKVPDRALTGMIAELGQPVWRPGSPAGFDDVMGTWAGPDALFRRAEVAERLASQAPSTVDPRALAQRLFPDNVSSMTAEAIARADSPHQGLALLFVSPEMLRR